MQDTWRNLHCGCWYANPEHGSQPENGGKTREMEGKQIPTTKRHHTAVQARNQRRDSPRATQRSPAPTKPSMAALEPLASASSPSPAGLSTDAPPAPQPGTILLPAFRRSTRVYHSIHLLPPLLLKFVCSDLAGCLRRREEAQGPDGCGEEA
jgi:hypothetical protein